MPDSPNGKSILVTGGAGFIGQHLVDALIKENDVRVLDDFSTGSREDVDDRATIIEGDIRDPEVVTQSMEGVDIVFHEAAVIDVEASVEDPIGTNEINCDGTLHVLEAAKEANARVVLASSTAVYGQPTHIPIEESDAKQPLSPYGLQKLTLDHYARIYHDLYGLETVVLRYFNVYGPKQSDGGYAGVINIFLKRARRGDPLVVHGGGTQTRDFVHVDDVVRANVLAASADVAGEAYNIGTGTSITITKLAELVRDVTDSDVEIVHGEEREGDIDRSEANIEKAQSHLGYEPRVTLRDGLGSLTE